MTTITRIITGTAILALTIVGTAALASQQRSQPTTPAPAAKPSFKDILGVGYEIKSVTFVPKDGLGSNATDSAVLVTLQKGSAVAVCEFYPGNWSLLAAASMEDTKRCDTYPTFVK